MKEEYHQIDSIIEAYLSGKLNDKGFQKLTEFIKQNSANHYYFKNYIRKWMPSEDADVERSWNELNSKILRVNTLEKDFQKKISIPKYLLRIAAVLVFGLILGSLIGVISISGLNRKATTFVFDVPKGEKSMITLPDSSKIWLNGGSNIKLTRNYGLTNRNIFLDGEAYFEVTKNKFLSFKVIANEVNIKVVGTKFNVSAYSNENLIETSIKEGIVQISPQNDKSFKEFFLTANQQASFNRATSKMYVNPADIETIISWKNNVLIIENEHYSKVFNKLENWYGVKFNIEGKLDYEPNYTLTIKTETLHEILELIHIITPLDYKIEGDQVYIILKTRKK